MYPLYVQKITIFPPKMIDVLLYECTAAVRRYARKMNGFSFLRKKRTVVIATVSTKAVAVSDNGKPLHFEK